MSILFQILFPYRLLQNIEYCSVCYTGGPCWLSILYIVVCVWCVYTRYVLDKAGDFPEPHGPVCTVTLEDDNCICAKYTSQSRFQKKQVSCWLCCGVNSFLCLIFILCGLWWINSVVLVSGVRSIHSLFIFFFVFFFLFIFNQRIIALQYCVGICHISTWINHRYTYVPSILNLPPTSNPILLPAILIPVCDSSSPAFRMI